jgi:RNA-splicing ligase RtcB
METVLLKDKKIELQQLDKAIHEYIPAGFKVRSTPHHFSDEAGLESLRCVKHMDLKRASLSLGTLGGGNHFIELAEDDNKQLYLVVHSGSRNLGKQACEYYQRAAAKSLGRKKGEDKVLAYLEGNLFDDYLHDMEIIQNYADLNRKAIIKGLEKRVKFKVVEQFTTTHNYIDLNSKPTMILRKGAISAQKGERVMIPLNMRDGSLICIGKGNADWNYSAPHGAGRIMSRSEAKASVTLTEFEKSMVGIYSTSVNRNTIDESPFAYKAADEITANIGDSAEIVKRIKPIYNFKAAE